MRTNTRPALSAAFAFCLALAATAGKPAFAQQSVAVGAAVQATADVVAIDKADRMLILRGPAGNIVELEVGEEARNFDQIRVGDQVTVTYYEAVAIYLGEHGEQPEEDAAVVVARSAKGDKPAGYAVGAVDVSASVTAIDRPTRTVTLLRPDGHHAVVKVDPSVKAFDTLAVGDTVHARYTEAIAIEVTRQ